MSRRLNCWEFKRCGRGCGEEAGGEDKRCPAGTEGRLDGVHGGVNAGRACWLVAGTMCGGLVQGSFAQKIESCVLCDFYRTVEREQKNDGDFMKP